METKTNITNKKLETIQMPALGRPFQLGMLYDCTRDQIILDSILWKADELKRYIVEEGKPESEYVFTAEDSLTEKTSFLEMNADLKLSFMCGLLEVNGAAKYLTDRKHCTHQSRVSFKYRCTTHFKELSLDNFLEKNNTRLRDFDKDNATHIVVGIIYGIESILMFDKKVSDDKNVKDTDIEIKAKVFFLPKLSFGTGSPTHDRRLQERDVQCKFYGDLKLEKNPSTFEEAIHEFNKLPSRIDKDGQNTVPVTVWLYPLSKLKLREPTVQNFQRVNFLMVNKIEDRFEELANLTMKCNDFLEKREGEYDDSLINDVKQLKNEIFKSEKELKVKLSENIPDVRKGLASDLQLNHILEDHMESTKGINTFFSNILPQRDRSDLQTKLRAGLDKLHAYKQEYDSVKVSKDSIFKTISFANREELSTYCRVCQEVCHKDCKLDLDADKSECIVMTEGKCTVCKGKCSWTFHNNLRYNTILEIMENKLESLKIEIEKQQDNVVSIIKQMAIMGMKDDSDPFGKTITAQYVIDNMISVEKHDQHSGYQDRIKELGILRKTLI